MEKDEAFEQWFASYAEAHKLPKGSPFRLAVWNHCKAAWEARGEMEEMARDSGMTEDYDEVG